MSMHVYDSSLEYSTDGGMNWTEIANVRALGDLDEVRQEMDTTVLKSTGAARERKRGWRNANETVFRTLYTGTVYDTLEGIFDDDPASDNIDFRVTLAKISGQSTNGDRFSGSGYISGLKLLGRDHTSDDPQEVEISVMWSGQLTYTAGT